MSAAHGRPARAARPRPRLARQSPPSASSFSRFPPLSCSRQGANPAVARHPCDSGQGAPEARAAFPHAIGPTSVSAKVRNFNASCQRSRCRQTNPWLWLSSPFRSLASRRTVASSEKPPACVHRPAATSGPSTRWERRSTATPWRRIGLDRMGMAPYSPAIQETMGAAASTMRHTRRRKGGTGLGWWQPWMHMWEIAVAAPEVVAHRTARMAQSGPTRSSADRRELARMTQEKFEAFGESASAMAAEIFKANLALWPSVLRAGRTLPSAMWMPRSGRAAAARLRDRRWQRRPCRVSYRAPPRACSPRVSRRYTAGPRPTPSGCGGPRADRLHRKARGRTHTGRVALTSV